MNRFLQRFALFSLPVLLLLGALEVLQHILPNNYTHKKQLLEAKASEIETLILGSSHTYLGINPEYLENEAFNLASTAQTLYFDKFLVEKYLDQLPQLKRVIVPVSYSSLGTESYLNPGDYNRSYHFAHFYGSQAFVGMLELRRLSLVSLFSIKKAVDRSIDYYTGQDSLVEFAPNGWYPTDVQRDLKQNGIDAGTFHDAYYDSSLFGTNLGYLEDMLARCRERQVEVIFLSMPMHPHYLKVVKQARYEAMVTKMDSFAAAQAVTYLNFTEDSRFADADFFDSNHLRTQGAEKFTKMLTDSLRKLSGAQVTAAQLR